MGGWVEPTRIGMPLLRRRRVPRWKVFSFLDLAIWAWKGPEMYAVTNESPLRKLALVLSCCSIREKVGFCPRQAAICQRYFTTNRRREQ